MSLWIEKFDPNRQMIMLNKVSLTDHIGMFAKLGLDQDLSIDGGTYSASGLSGLTNFTFNSSPTRTRPSAALGAYYDLSKTERLSFEASINKAAFQSTSTTSAMLTYAVGF
jgi:uncharacterized protein involved in copper resistance